MKMRQNIRLISCNISYSGEIGGHNVSLCVHRDSHKYIDTAETVYR